MTVDSVDYTDPVLRVKCSGPFGVGSKGNPSAKVLRETIESWMNAHPEQRVEQIAVNGSRQLRLPLGPHKIVTVEVVWRRAS